MFQSISKTLCRGTYAIVLLLVFTSHIGAKTVKPTDQDQPKSVRIKEVLDCTCECGLTLAFCEKEDADCSVRPALLTKLNKLLDGGKRGMALIHAFMGPMHPVKEQLMEARLRNRHTILFFYQKGCKECDDVKPILTEGAEVWGDRVQISHVDINKKENKKIQQEFRIFSSPTVLVIAPNGVVVSEMKKNITIERLESAFISPAMAEILRGLQDQRVIFLTVQAPDWKHALSVKRDVSKGGEILRNSVRIVQVDPTNMEERPLLKMLKVATNQDQALTFVISQTGQLGSRFEGPVSRKDLFMAFQKVLAARSGCGGSGSGVGGNTCK